MPVRPGRKKMGSAKKGIGFWKFFGFGGFEVIGGVFCCLVFFFFLVVLFSPAAQIQMGRRP